MNKSGVEANMDVVTEALKSPAVDALYKAIIARGPITFGRETGDTHWGSATVDGKTIITAVPTKYPAAALYHELLHAKLKLDGYQQRRILVSMDGGLEMLKAISEALDNEMQHHRMIMEFLKGGFRSDQFYHDDDVSAYKETRHALQGLNQNSLPGEFLLPFLTVIAPGGAGTEEERQKLKNLFRANTPPTIWEMLSRIEEAFGAWSQMQSLDAGDTIVYILRQLGYNRTWIGLSEDFPGAGRFVGKPFTIEEAKAWYAANPPN
jgi:hypothetical protein